MRKRILSLLMFGLALTCSAQDAVYTRQFDDAGLVQRGALWTESGVWKNGFTKGEPDDMVNTTEFFIQYNRRPELWKAMFNWLEQTDLLSIPAGKHNIEGTTLVASVEDSNNEELEKRKSESHFFNIDFMFVVKGTEGFLLLDHNSSQPNTTYKTDVVRYKYQQEKSKFIESTPGRFMIMFPDDWHVAKVKTTKDDQSIRVIVVKMPYII